MKKVTFPHMGMVYAPMQVLFHQLGIDVVVPPPCNAESLARARQYSPETMCIPYKLVLGNFLEGLERGANALILLGGPNNCRFGYYSILAEQVLRDLGYEFEMLTPQISSRTISGVTDILRHLADYRVSTLDCIRVMLLALTVLRDIDTIERRVQWVRARELQQGIADRIFEEAGQAFSQVDSFSLAKRVKKEVLAKLDDVPIDRGHKPIRICLVGEIYVVNEPYMNYNLERELGKRGVEVIKSEQLSQWIVLSPALLLEAAGYGHEARIARAARPYLDHLHGETVGQTIMAEREGFDGVIQLTPFTCMPEIVNQNVLLKLQQEHDIPVLTLVLDEHTAQAGIVTRLEAFTDLLARRRGVREGAVRVR